MSIYFLGHTPVPDLGCPVVIREPPNTLSLAPGGSCRVTAALSWQDHGQTPGLPLGLPPLHNLSSAPAVSSEAASLPDFLLLLHFFLTPCLCLEPTWIETTTVVGLGGSLGPYCCPSSFAPSGEDAGPETPNSTPVHYPACSCISASRAESRSLLTLLLESHLGGAPRASGGC